MVIRVRAAWVSRVKIPSLNPFADARLAGGIS